MKALVTLCVVACFSVGTFAQIQDDFRIDLPKLNLNGLHLRKNPVSEKKENSKQLELNTPSEIHFSATLNPMSPQAIPNFNIQSRIDAVNFGTLRPLEMQFGKPKNTTTYTYSEQPNYLREEGGDSRKASKRDQHFGDIRTKTTFLVFKFRDFGRVDGDVVRLLVNDKVLIPEVVLTGGFKTFKLPVAFNEIYRIDFMALNMGAVGVNTAQLIILDDKSDVLLNNQWWLFTGFKATVVIINEP